MKSLRIIGQPASCDSCPLYHRQLGLDSERWDAVIALAGNPNTGKSTIFNALTGLRQHTGNWPGKTVTRAEGGYRFAGKRFKLVDLPGTYSLLTATTDEEVARDFVLFGRPDCTVIVVDATCVERNLNLVLQILEITDKAVVALNLIDEAERKGISVNHRRLARRLGIPVVPVVAKTGQGLGQLIQAIADVVTGTVRTSPRRVRGDAAYQHAVDELAAMLTERYPELPNAAWIAMRLLDGDQRVREALATGEFGRHDSDASDGRHTHTVKMRSIGAGR